MRKLRQYINEISNISTLKQHIYDALEDKDTVEVKNLVVTWITKDKVYVESPEKYSESDLQIYLDDIMLDELPGGKTYSEKFFGKNADNIVDAYLAYDSMEEAMGEEQEPDLKWDSRYDSKINSEDKLHVVCINNLKYVLVFEKFELINTDSASIKSDIIDIMTTTNSNYTNKYPIEITFDSKNIEYIEE